MAKKNAKNNSDCSLTATSSLREKTVLLSWGADLYKDTPIVSNVENTWIERETVVLANLADVTIKAGNKDYYLDATTEDGERTSELTLKKRYR